MAKPIFIVGIPNNRDQNYLETMSKKLSEKLDDYHVIVYQTRYNAHVFKCFYEKDFEEIDLDNLSREIKKMFEGDNYNG